MVANVQNTPNAEFSDNILPYSATFDDNLVAINKTGGTAGSSASFVTNKYFTGKQCLRLLNDSTSTPLDFNLGTALQHTINKTGFYRVSLMVSQEQNPLSYNPHKLTLNIFEDGVVVTGKKIEMTLPTEDDDNGADNFMREIWYKFEGRFEIGTSPVVVNYSFTFENKDITLGQDAEIWIDGFKVEYQDRMSNYFLCTKYTRPKNGLELLPTVDGEYKLKVASGVISYLKTIETTATLDFPSTASGGEADLTIALSGAVVGRNVEVIPPSALQGVYRAFCDTVDVITVRFINTTGATYDPASGSFKVIQ